MKQPIFWILFLSLAMLGILYGKYLGYFSSQAIVFLILCIWN